MSSSSKNFKRLVKGLTYARFIVGVGFVIFIGQPPNARATGYREPPENYSSVNYTTPGKRKPGTSYLSSGVQNQINSPKRHNALASLMCMVNMEQNAQSVAKIFVNNFTPPPGPPPDTSTTDNVLLNGNNGNNFGGTNHNGSNVSNRTRSPKLVQFPRTSYPGTSHMSPPRYMNSDLHLHNRTARVDPNPPFFSQEDPFQNSVPRDTFLTDYTNAGNNTTNFNNPHLDNANLSSSFSTPCNPLFASNPLNQENLPYGSEQFDSQQPGCAKFNSISPWNSNFNDLVNHPQEQTEQPTMEPRREQILFSQNGVQTMGHILTQNSLGLGLLNSATETPVSNPDTYRPRRGRKNEPRRITINFSPYPSFQKAYTIMSKDELKKLDINSDSVINTRVMAWRYPNYFLGHVNGELPEKFKFPVMAKTAVSGQPPIFLGGIKFMNVDDAYAKSNTNQNKPFEMDEILFRLKSAAYPNDYYDYLDKNWLSRNLAVLPQLNEYKLKEYRCKQMAQWENRLSGTASFSAPRFINPVFNNSSKELRRSYSLTESDMLSLGAELRAYGNQTQLQPMASAESRQIQQEPLQPVSQIIGGSLNEPVPFNFLTKSETLSFCAEMSAYFQKAQPGEIDLTGEDD